MFLTPQQKSTRRKCHGYIAQLRFIKSKWVLCLTPASGGEFEEKKMGFVLYIYVYLQLPGGGSSFSNVFLEVRYLSDIRRADNPEESKVQ